jgi:glutamate-1-semialdehyde 2,1-aminomutase
MKPSTNSKEHMPVIRKAKGKYVWDIEGNKYLDTTGSNLTVIHGYRPAIGVTPNLPGKSDCEAKLGAMLGYYTHTSHFRYYKNGSDAVNNAVRLSKHILGNSNASTMYIGYAGSNDSYAYTVNKNGITEQASWQYKKGNIQLQSYDILVFESRFSDIACNIDAKIRICDHLKSGVVGLYEFWLLFRDKEADFHCFGKSIANGSALAVLTGKDELMERIDEVYYSTTFGCNQDAMLEAIRTIKDFEKVQDKYFKLYSYAKDKLPEWQSITPEQIKKFQKLGVLFNGYWQIFTIHTKRDIDRLAKVIDIVL